MGIRKDLKQIKQELSIINSSSTIEKVKKYEELIKYLEDVKIQVDNVKEIFDENGNCFVMVNYKIPPVKIYIDGDGSTIPNARFKAINMLNLISFEEMQNISSHIESAKRKNN